jgi:HAD superfamily 5'-nucleotidase-like hydrolase
MSSIDAIGFDMDHTLAIYNTETFSRLCFELAIEQLIQRKGYPQRIREISYDGAVAMRGVIVDKRLGNLQKVDAYSYVSRVRHGGRLLSREERRQQYKRGRIRIGSERYRVFDTLFDLPEGSLYTALVALKDLQPELLTRSYRVLFNDIREAIDGIHRDGTLKRHLIAALDRFFVTDPELLSTLLKFRQTGKRLFLLTNSEVDYTAAVMHHLLGDAQLRWEEIFDLVICSAGKPDFFVSRGGGRPVGRGAVPHLANRQGNCFTGGDAFFLESKIGTLGDTILYFGDHTYGDILRSKLSVGWRTAMIIPELEDEIRAMARVRHKILSLRKLEEDLEELVLERDFLLAQPRPDKPRCQELEAAIAAGLGRRGALQRQVAGAFNPYWGSLFKEGHAASRFGAQVQEFACIYTSRVSNFLHYPADKFFAKPAEWLPHEQWFMGAS